MTLFQKYSALSLDGIHIGFEKGSAESDYFCTPKGMRILGWDNGGIHFGTIRGYGKMIFAVNPEPASDRFVYPLAADFEDFLRLILACGHTANFEQTIWQTKTQFEDALTQTDFTEPNRKVLLSKIAKELSLDPMPKPYEYVKELQSRFDESKLRYPKIYYETLGLADHKPESRCDFVSVTVVSKKSEN